VGSNRRGERRAGDGQKDGMNIGGGGGLGKKAEENKLNTKKKGELGLFPRDLKWHTENWRGSY